MSVYGGQIIRVAAPPALSQIHDAANSTPLPAGRQVRPNRRTTKRRRHQVDFCAALLAVTAIVWGVSIAIWIGGGR